MADKDAKKPAAADAKQKIRIRLKAYDHKVIDQAAKQIVDTARCALARVLPDRFRYQLVAVHSRLLKVRMFTRRVANSLKCASTSA